MLKISCKECDHVFYQTSWKCKETDLAKIKCPLCLKSEIKIISEGSGCKQEICDKCGS